MPSASEDATHESRISEQLAAISFRPAPNQLAYIEDVRRRMRNVDPHAIVGGQQPVVAGRAEQGRDVG